VTSYLLDTDTFSLYLQKDVKVSLAVFRHLASPMAVSIITVREVWDGWAAAIARAKNVNVLAATYTRLTETVVALSAWTVLSFSVAAIARYENLKQQKLNVGGNDLRIASISLELGATVVTRNRRDFSRIPGVVIEDWSV
jgi:tRNA(fMet)-specific endonuclease VapC